MFNPAPLSHYRRAAVTLIIFGLLTACLLRSPFPTHAGGEESSIKSQTITQSHPGPIHASPTLNRYMAATTIMSASSTMPQTSCLVNPPIDPSPMDCYTSLVANHDDFPLGTRTPVILIHGIHASGTGPNFTPDENTFARLIAHLNSNATFRERFKLYRFHYSSDFLPVYQIARSLRNRIDDLVKQNLLPEDRKFVLIAHSMGGLVARSYMNEHDTDFGSTFKGQKAGKRISRLITLATPHHGTYGSNDKARLTGDRDWGAAFDAADFVYWEYRAGCSACNDDPSHPNRSDLRFDNFNGLWDDNPAYVNDPKEQNGWLQNLPKSYDSLISAYYGYIGGNSLVSDLGSRCPETLGPYLLLNRDNTTLQTGSGVLLTRIALDDFGSSFDPRDCGSPIFFLHNDGLVPFESGMYKGASVARQASCLGYDHDEMLHGTGGNCQVLNTSVQKPLFDLVTDELLALQLSTSDTQAPTISITSPTSNSTLTTTGSAINLAGGASDNVGVTRVTWTNNRGGSGTASGTANWSISGVALQSGTNVLTVNGQDTAGNIGSDTLTVTFNLTVNDTSPPSISINSPTSSSTYTTTGSTLTLRGTATDNIGVTQVTWSNSRGGSGTASGTTNWTANVTGLQSGTNILTVRARDAAGNSQTATLTVTFNPPSTCGNGTSENYRVNGGPPLHPNGSLVKLRNDPTVFLIQNGQRRGIPSQAILNNLYQNGGFQDKDVIIIAADEMSRYPLGSVINSTLPSNGRSHPDGRLIKRVGGTEISMVSAGVRRPFASESTFLGLGFLYCNVVSASDYDSYPVGILVDATTTLRIVTVTPSSQQTRDWGGSVTYTFTVADGNGTPVSGAAVGGQDNLRGIGVFLATSSTDANGRGTYTTAVPNGKANGVYDIIFLADKTGYTRSDAVTRQVRVDHFQDTAGPTVSILSPTSNTSFSTTSSPISVSGIASDNVGVTQVSWTNDRGGSGNASGTSNWSISGIALQNGTNLLTITARDAAGNIGTANLAVVYTPPPSDAIPPTVTITTPTTSTNYQTSSTPITLSGTASDNVGLTQVQWTNDRGGSGVATGTNNWTASNVSLQVGFNVITVIAVDTAGNIGTATLIVNWVPAGLIITEFRLRGPNGSNDEYVELYNNTDQNIVVSTGDGSIGWALASSDGVGGFVIPTGTVIPARSHYLAVGDGYSLAVAATGDLTYSSELSDDVGLALFATANPLNFSLVNRLDAVGFATSNIQYREGSGLPVVGANGGEYCFVRNLSFGLPRDLGDNASDFVFVAVDGGTYGSLVAVLGSPGPENLSSPIQLNAKLPASLLDPAVSATASPNRIRDTAAVGPNAAFGTLTIRRTFTNNTLSNVSLLRFRVIDFTTLNSPGYVPGGSQADLRLLTSNDVIVTLSSGQTVHVRGTTLNPSPAQNNGGGLNTGMGVGFISLSQPLAPGQSVSVQFVLGVQQTGTFRFFFNLEAVVQ
jgi:pimeloyl-ACP methyl ester carboxylesterase